VVGEDKGDIWDDNKSLYTRSFIVNEKLHECVSKSVHVYSGKDIVSGHHVWRTVDSDSTSIICVFPFQVLYVQVNTETGGSRTSVIN
jgi:hypothetical protein